MIKSKIEWTDYSINIIKGYCPNTCSYCYSHRMYNRFKWDKTIRYDVNELKKLKTIKEPSKIFVGSMIDMYHEDIPLRWVREIIKITRNYPGHTFITLTKFPENLNKFDFPENWWIGITEDGEKGSIRDVCLVAFTDNKNKRFISFEPMLTEKVTNYNLKHYDWIIIGGLTPKSVHKTEWIDDIVSRADKLKIPVYIKDNANYNKVRKFFPNFKV